MEHPNLKPPVQFQLAKLTLLPRLAGEVVSVNVEEGAQVIQGDELFRLDDFLLKAQLNQAKAAVALAEVTLSAATAQYDLVLNAARLQDKQNRVSSWNTSQPSQFDLPVWYFDKGEKLGPRPGSNGVCHNVFYKEKANLEKVLTNVASQEFLSTEKKVANAQAAFIIADQVLSQAKKRAG